MHIRKLGTRAEGFILAVAALLFAAGVAQADLIVAVQSVTASAGSTGDTLDVTLADTGPAAVTVQGFSFGLSPVNPGISFTAATTATTLASYIFGADSFFGPEIDTSNGPSLTASDEDSTFLGVTVSANSTVGLGHVFFNVASSVPAGQYSVNLTAPATSLSDPANNDIPIDSLVAGTLTVTSRDGAVPEPSTWLLGLIGAVLLVSATRDCPAIWAFYLQSARSTHVVARSFDRATTCIDRTNLLDATASLSGTTVLVQPGPGRSTISALGDRNTNQR
jgi:hypothetical protein